MNKKAKGIGFEREIIHLFWDKQWAAIRVAGSGSMNYPSPDILAGNNIRKVGIECKNTSGKNVYIPKREVEELKKFCVLFGAEPWIAVKFGKGKIFFINIEDMKKTVNNFGVNESLARMKGLMFEEIVN